MCPKPGCQRWIILLGSKEEVPRPGILVWFFWCGQEAKIKKETVPPAVKTSADLT